MGDVRLELVLDGGALRLAASLNGKNYRKMLKAIDANNGNVSIILQGSIQPQQSGAWLVMESAGFAVNVKTPTEKAPEPPVVAQVNVAPEPKPEPTPRELAPLPGTALPGRKVYIPPKRQRRGYSPSETVAGQSEPSA